MVIKVSVGTNKHIVDDHRFKRHRVFALSHQREHKNKRFLVTPVTCIDGEHDWYYQEAQSHPCQRSCVPGDVKTCYYRFSIEWYWAFGKACYDCPRTLTDCYRKDCVPAGGVERFITVVNIQMPGPSIEVCHGDKLEVEVENMMDDQTTSIHWYGHHQVKTPYMDGVPFITQCPISPNSVFRYTMQVTNPGTHFWHGHTGWQKSSGVFGPLIVRSAPSAEASLLYDLDLSEHTILINDWTRVTVMAKFQMFVQSNGNKSPEAIFVNGMGRYYNDSNRLTHTPLAVFTVQQEKHFDVNHPIHLHGYAFHVIGMDRLGESVDEELVKKLNREGRVVRNLENPPLKDSVTVPDGGYTIIRSHANNPGRNQH
ncbi:laccase-1-like [Homalodisca vitripennis]|uniref:laccase-1-like n=1 Tax=Homalodisca vitripennis TaxID=197043 RepID=UPI001EEA681C|nr:laccase-1-like [Homalodisca vitripennis]